MGSKKYLVLVGLVLLASGLYAAGAQEDPLAQYRDRVKLTGTLQFSDGYAEIAAGGQSYTLLAPGVQRVARTLKAGLKLSVEGFKVQADPRMIRTRPKGEYVVVEKVSVEGKDFDLSKMRMPAMAGNHSGPMMQGGMAGEMKGNMQGQRPRRSTDGGPEAGMRGGRGGFEGEGPDMFDFQEEGFMPMPSEEPGPEAGF